MSTGFFGTRASWVADINLMLQIVLLVVVCVGALQAKRGHWAAHHSCMVIAVLVQAAAIVFVMNPSFFRALPSTLDSPAGWWPIVMWSHMVCGTMAELLGVYIVIRSQMGTATASWPGNRRVMQATLVLWLIAVLVGLALYMVWYV